MMSIRCFGKSSLPCFSRWAALLLAAVCLPLTAADPNPPVTDPNSPKPKPPAPVLEFTPNPNSPDVEKQRPLDEILVLVNSIPVYSHTLNDIINARVKAAQKAPDSIALRNARRDEIRNLVHIELIRQFIDANQIKLDQDKFKQYIDFLDKEATSRYGEPLQAVLRRSGADYKQWYNVQKYIFMLRDFAANQVTDETLDAYIRQHEDRMPLRRARQILVAYDKSIKHAIPGRSKEQALAKAKEIIGRLQKGESFAELAMAEGDSPEALDGGLLPFIERKPKDEALVLAKPFVDAVYTLAQVGDFTTEPVETPYGYHIVQLIDIRRDTPNQLHPYNNLRKYVMNTPEYYNELVEVKWQEMIDKARTRSTIQFFGEFEDLNEKPKAANEDKNAPAGDKSTPANDKNVPANDKNVPAGSNGGNGVLPPKDASGADPAQH